ncbi:hypothetical protein HPB50_023988 [Hyalomma asiaticum]|uniref:Uncharacterized protein n=1 Tax=Hyalomma asiaticum TaxID=266040 RepID=A0ACB7SCE4_HYAAI|nr:hypothetical protein HPB50_023988 [Hyalomma asiaticum]
MARRGRRFPGRGGLRGRVRGGRRGGRRGGTRGGHHGGHHVRGHGNARHQAGARGRWPRGPDGRRLRGHWRLRPSSRRGEPHKSHRPTKSEAARDDMDFVDEVEKPSSAIADAIDESSSTSSQEVAEGPPLEAEKEKLKQEAEARKQKEADEAKEKEEEARRLKEAQEQEEKKQKEARKVEEEMKRSKEEEPKKRDEEEVRRRREGRREEEERRRHEEQEMEDEERRQREQLWDEEEYARRRFRQRRREEEEKIRRLKEERRRLDEENALRQLQKEAPDKEENSINENVESLLPMTKHILEVVNNLEKKSTMAERPPMVEAATETGNDIFYQRPEQGVMRNEEIQAAPMKQPVASYIIKRPRSETRLQRLLSFFGLASPEEPDHEVIEYNFMEPTATASPYEDRQGGSVRYEEGQQRQRERGRKMRRQEKHKESPESSDSEEDAHELDAKAQDDDARKQSRKRLGYKKKSKSTPRRDVRKDVGLAPGKTSDFPAGQPNKPKVRASEGTAANTQGLSGMRYVEEINEEVMRPQVNNYGQPVGPWLRTMRVVRPLETFPPSAAQRHIEAQPNNIGEVKSRPEPSTEEHWKAAKIEPSARQVATEQMIGTYLNTDLPAQGASVSGRAHMPQTTPFASPQFQEPTMAHTLGPWDISRPFSGGHGYYAGPQQGPYFQVQHTPSYTPIKQPVYDYTSAQCTHMYLPYSRCPRAVCTCVVKCGNRCIGFGRRKSSILEPPEPRLLSSTSDYKCESPTTFEDTAPIHSEPSIWVGGRRLEDLEARIRAEQEARLLRSKLRLLEAGSSEEGTHVKELDEEEALKWERQLLERELHRLKEGKQAGEGCQRQDLGLAQLSRIEERLRFLEQGQNVYKEVSAWNLDETPTPMPVGMPWPYAAPPYGLPAEQMPPDSAPWRTRQRGGRTRRCSDAGSESAQWCKSAKDVFPGEREDGVTTAASLARNTKDLSEDTNKGGHAREQDDIPVLGRLIPFFCSASLADNRPAKHVSYKPDTAESKVGPADSARKVGLEPTSSEQRASVNTVGNAASTQEKLTVDKTSVFDGKPLTTVQLEPEVPDVALVKHRKSISPKGMHRKTRLPSHNTISSEIDSLLSGLSDTDYDSVALPKHNAMSRKRLQTSSKRGADSNSNTLSDSSSTSPAQLSNASGKPDGSVGSAPKPKQWQSFTNAGSRLLGVLMPTSPKKDSVPDAHSVLPVPSVAPRKPKPVAPQGRPDTLSLEETANEEPYTTDDFMNQMKGESAEKLREAPASKSTVLDSLLPEDSVKHITESKSADSKDVFTRSAPKPSLVAKRSKFSKSVTQRPRGTVDDEVQSLEKPSPERPLPLLEEVADLSNKFEDSVKPTVEMNTNTPDKAPASSKRAPDSVINASANQRGSIMVCEVLMPCSDEAAEEEHMFEITETPQDLFPERSFVAIVSLLTLLWITIVLSSTTFLSPKLKAGAPTDTTKPTRPSISSYSHPKTSARTTNHAPTYYLCDSEYCAKEGNFLKSLLSEADYPCEDFYEHICQRWAQRRTAEVTGGGATSEDVLLEDRMERALLSYFRRSAAKLEPTAQFMKVCENSASSASIDEVRQFFKHGKIREWPVRTYEARHHGDAWIFAGELLRDIGLPVLADIYVAADPFNAQRGIITLMPPEQLYFTRDTQSDLVDRAVKETLLAFNVSDPNHVERLADEIMTVFDVLERLADEIKNATVLNDCELHRDIFKLLSRAIEYDTNNTRQTTCNGITHVQLLSTEYFMKLPEVIGNVTANALLNHLGFRALVRLAAFMPDSLRALRELSYLEVTGRSEVPDIDNLCLRSMEVILPLCLAKALALPLLQNNVALWQRRWLSELESTFLQALPRVPWLDELALFALAFRLRRMRVDPPLPIMVKGNTDCLPVDLAIGNTLTDILGLFREIRTRRIVLELRSGPDWSPPSPLNMWPYLDGGLRRIRIPSGPLQRLGSSQ